ncbi:hypothetical protein KP509_35G025000 [Ceratopteris richardii]|uniref:Uncharacterized protein n=1 Tax=Ceratopteris richardii TaxID=49495 RepID=A0A8T2QFX1_CERRI|nr:hypothetical protein KP509_35G025000 [Ceratopteris richardii]
MLREVTRVGARRLKSQDLAFFAWLILQLGGLFKFATLLMFFWRLIGFSYSVGGDTGRGHPSGFDPRTDLVSLLQSLRSEDVRLLRKVHTKIE